MSQPQFKIVESISWAPTRSLCSDIASPCCFVLESSLSGRGPRENSIRLEV